MSNIFVWKRGWCFRHLGLNILTGWGWGLKAKIRFYRSYWVGGSECSGRPISFFFIKKKLICPMTKHHVEPNINILFTRNISIDSGVRQWSHPLMIPLHCLWTKSNKRTRGQFECDMTLFLFCSFTCTVRLLFHSLLERGSSFKIGGPESKKVEKF